MGKTEILAAMDALKLTIAAEFVPFSKSRHRNPPKGEKQWRCLNWRVTVKRDGRDVLITDYSAGEGHCPGSSHHDRSIARGKLVAFELEHGVKGTYYASTDRVDAAWPRKPIMPDPCDIMHSLASDSDVLDSGGFEQWASDLGYDTDSRKAEVIYRACLEMALQLRAGLGEDGLRTLREACQDY